MPTPGSQFRPARLRARAVFIDTEFEFVDGDKKPKWIVLLSDINDHGIIFSLTTSKVKTYHNSLRMHIKVRKIDEPCFAEDCIIEIERTTLASAEKIQKKNENNKLISRGLISEKLHAEILDMIAECPTIPEYIKTMLGV